MDDHNDLLLIIGNRLVTRLGLGHGAFADPVKVTAEYCSSNPLLLDFDGDEFPDLLENCFFM